MKKLFVVMTALALMAGAVSCSKDDDSSNNNSSNPPSGPTGNDATEYAENLAEGRYQPLLHLNKITSEGEDLYTFTWEENTLMSVNGVDGLATLSYGADGLLQKSSINGTKYQYAYNGGKLSGISILATGDLLMAHQNVVHNGAHITAVNYDSVSMLYLIPLLQQYVDLNFKGSSKYSFGVPSMKEIFEWEGDNAKKHTISAGITIGIAPSEVSQYVDLGEIIRAYIAAAYPSIDTTNTLTRTLINTLVNYIVNDTQEIPIELVLSVNEQYNYDAKRNIMQYLWMSAISAQNLSANNITNATMTSTISAVIHYTLPASLSTVAALLGGNSTFDIPFSKEMKNESVTSSYQYNSHNFPVSLSATDGTKLNYKYN